MPLALVTGGSAGIGHAFAERLAAQGHDLVLVARGAERLHRVAAVLRGRHGRTVDVLVADLTTPAGRAAVEARVADPARPVDVLVANAGVHVGEEFAQAALPRLQTEVDVNVSGALRLTHLALPGMLARGHGSVILVSSFAGILPARGSAYGVSRAWAVTFADTLAAALRGTGVRVTAVCPGYVRTESLPHVPAGAGLAGLLVLEPAEVARRALADNRAGRAVSVPGLVHRAVWTWLDLPRRTLRLPARLARSARDQRAPAPAAVRSRAGVAPGGAATDRLGSSTCPPP